MTSLRRRLDNVLGELNIIREVLGNCNSHPPCCLRFHEDGKVSCDVMSPLPEKIFLRRCLKCRSKIKNFLDSVRS